ncbi:hypothetical protein ROZALSC1DRAFT_25553, partial [Rozella allomycis CSF55]
MEKVREPSELKAEQQNEIEAVAGLATKGLDEALTSSKKRTMVNNVNFDDDEEDINKPKKTWKELGNEVFTVEYFKKKIKNPFMFFLIVFNYYIVLWLLMKHDIEPGTTMFSLILVVTIGILGG